MNPHTSFSKAPDFLFIFSNLKRSNPSRQPAVRAPRTPGRRRLDVGHSPGAAQLPPVRHYPGRGVRADGGCGARSTPARKRHWFLKLKLMKEKLAFKHEPLYHYELVPPTRRWRGTARPVGLRNRPSDWSTLYDCMCMVRWYNTMALRGT